MRCVLHERAFRNGSGPSQLIRRARPGNSACPAAAAEYAVGVARHGSFRRSVMLSCLSLVVLGLAAPGDAPDAKKELEKLQGTWSVVSVDDNGVKAQEEALKKRKVILKDETYTVADDGATVEEGAFSIDPSKKPPA